MIFLINSPPIIDIRKFYKELSKLKGIVKVNLSQKAIY